jgi:hypothetical protein
MLMNNKIHQRLWSLAKAGLAIVLFFGGAQAAMAATSLAADHAISNIATVDYSDVNSTVYAPVVSLPVIVKVRLVSAAPEVALNTAATGSLVTLVQNTTFDLVYTVTNKSNGIESITTATTAPVFANTVDTPLTSATADATTTSLSGTTLASVIGVGSLDTGETLTFDVPSDDTPGTVNGFIAGQKLKFDGVDLVCTISGISESNVANAVSTLTVGLCVNPTDGLAYADGLSPAVAVGIQIGQQISLTVTLNIGTDGAGDGTSQIFFTAGGTTGVNEASDTQNLTVIGVDLKIIKYVRNVTQSNLTGTGGSNCDSIRKCLTLDGNTYYAADITAEPTHVLEYAILVVNDGLQTADSVVVTDVIGNAAFVNFTDASSLVQLLTKVRSATVCTDAVNICVLPTTTPIGGGVATPTTLETAGTTTLAYADLTTGTLTVSAGYGTIDTGSGTEAVSPAAGIAGGFIEGGDASVVLFQVVVD